MGCTSTVYWNRTIPPKDVGLGNFRFEHDWGRVASLAHLRGREGMLVC